MLNPTDFYLLRTPSFSVDKLLVLNKSIEEKDITSIKNIFKNTFFLNAIYFSSRYFYKVANSWLEKEDLTFVPDDRVLLTLYKYYSRICTRATPYGLFAGFDTGILNDNKSEIKFETKGSTPIFRADMLFLKKVKDKILTKNRNKKIKYFPNNTIYQAGNGQRYIEWDENYNYEISEVSSNPILDIILEKSIKGLFFHEIITIIEYEIPDMEKHEMLNYADSLIENKILIDKLPPFLTSLQNPTEELEEYLAATDIQTSDLQSIKKYKPYENNTVNIENIEKLASVYSDILDEKHQIFQVDLSMNLKKNHINLDVVRRICKSALELACLVKNQKSDDLIKFANEFAARFEEKEISLVHALDPQIGIGYGLQVSGNIEEMPLIQDIYFSYPNRNHNTTHCPILHLVLDKYSQHFDTQTSAPIVLQEEDIKKASINNDPPILDSEHYFFGDLLTDSFEDLDQGKFKFFGKAPWPNSYVSSLLGRFSYHDEVLRSKMKHHLKIENKEYITAEIIHHPSDRLGNVLMRPNFYSHEIPYVTPSKGDKVVIAINDLMVSVVNEKIIIRSRSLNKEIRPRLSSAYNYSSSQLSIIRFLGDLQYQNGSICQELSIKSLYFQKLDGSLPPIKARLSNL
jgi:hypothetical protein